jgi:hypothetical protein
MAIPCKRLCHNNTTNKGEIQHVDENTVYFSVNGFCFLTEL